VWPHQCIFETSLHSGGSKLDTHDRAYRNRQSSDPLALILSLLVLTGLRIFWIQLGQIFPPGKTYRTLPKAHNRILVAVYPSFARGCSHQWLRIAHSQSQGFSSNRFMADRGKNVDDIRDFYNSDIRYCCVESTPFPFS
jgi:hypothetical protein